MKDSLRDKSKIVICFLLVATTAPFLLLAQHVDFSLFFSNKQIFWVNFFYTFGSIFGLVGTILLFWQFVLGSRIIVARYSKDLVWYNTLHKNIGKYGMLFVLFHPFLELFNYATNYFYLLNINFSSTVETYISLGRIAFILFLLLWISSAFLRGKMKYRPWVYLHTLSYPIMFLVLLHARVIGSYLNLYPFLQYTWITLTVLFTVFSIYRLAKFVGWRTAVYELINKEKVGSNIFIYTFKARKKTLVPKVGQFIYIQTSRFGYAHPFTVMESNMDENTLTFGIKALGKFTKDLSNIEPGAKVWMDGPYGVYTLEGQNHSPKVIIAGGIGITPFVDLIRKYSNDETYLYYANEKIDDAVRRDMFKEKLQSHYYDVLSHEEVSDKNVIQGRLNIDIMKQTLPEKLIKTAEFFICGSKGFYKNYKNMLLALNISPNRIHYEEFGF